MSPAAEMLIVLDPAPFLESELGLEHLDSVLWILNSCSAAIPGSAKYWSNLQNAILPKARSNRAFLAKWQALNRFKLAEGLPEVGSDSVSGMRLGALEEGLDEAWQGLLNWTLATCVASGRKTWLVTRLWEGRGLIWHRAGDSMLEEKTVWQVGEEGSRSIPVAATLRNVRLPWTARYSDELPAEEDGARFPFCPPANWASPKITAFRPKEQRYCWVDAKDNFWGDPGTPDDRNAGRKPYHWDVWLHKKWGQWLAKQLGQGLPTGKKRKHVNIVRFGAPAEEGPAGEIHHPLADRERIRSGWKC